MIDRLIDTLKTGHADIDDDHALLVTPLRDAWYVANRGGDPRAVSKHLETFLYMCEGHFRREEDILAQAGYPDVDDHASFHNLILDKVHETMNCFRAAQTWEQRRQCIEGVIGLMVDDIIKGDMAYVSFLQEQGLAPHRP